MRQESMRLPREKKEKSRGKARLTLKEDDNGVGRKVHDPSAALGLQPSCSDIHLLPRRWQQRPQWLDVPPLYHLQAPLHPALPQLTVKRPLRLCERQQESDTSTPKPRR